MSKVAIKGADTGTATFTIEAPATSTNRTLTLPDAAGNVVLDSATQTLTNKTLTSPTVTTPTIDSAQVPTVSGTAPLYMCRAWVNFNGTGTVAIRAAGNVSSITDNGTGDYTVNFTTAMVDANYCVDGSSSVGTLGAAETRGGVLTVLQSATNNVRVLTPQNSDNGSNPGYRDYAMNSVAIFR